jgi:hypothetical protein
MRRLVARSLAHMRIRLADMSAGLTHRLLLALLSVLLLVLISLFLASRFNLSLSLSQECSMTTTDLFGALLGLASLLLVSSN